MSAKKTILLIDDEPEVLAVLESILKAPGYSIIARTDARSSLEVIKEGKKVDLVITDLMMPEMDGSELAAKIRKTLPGVPVIMLTGHGSVETYIRTRSEGVFEYIHKPVKAKELRRIVQAAIGDPGRTVTSQ